MIEARVHSIESFGTVDGPGIRYVIFLQGCPLRCAYCHNPDTWNYDQGNLMDSDTLLESFNRNRAFYSGGITVSGGEPLLQIDFLIEFFTKAKIQNIHTCLDTSGAVFDEKNKDKYEQLCKVTDLILLDIKQIDATKHLELTKMNNSNVLKFAKFVDEHSVPMWIRHVYVNDEINSKEDLVKLGEFLGTLDHIKNIDVLPYHTMGVYKYEQLNLEYRLSDSLPATKEQTTEARKIIVENYRKIKKMRDHI